MNLRELAEQDLLHVLEDNSNGFGYLINVTNPAGTTESFYGQSGDISQVVDPETGVIVSGRLAHVVIRISSLYSKGFGLPEGIADVSGAPWIIEFNDVNGLSYKFKVSRSNPDRTLGVVNCLLEKYV